MGSFGVLREVIVVLGFKFSFVQGLILLVVFKINLKSFRSWNEG